MISRTRSIVRSLALVVVSIASAAVANAQTVTWTGGGNGTSWSQAANWSSNPALPGAANDVVIPAGAQAITADVNVTIRSLSLDRALNLGAVCNNLTVTNGITLPTAAGVLNTAQIGCNQVVFNGTQSITGAGEIAVAAGSMRVAGTSTLTVGPGVTIRNVAGLSGTITLDAGATLLNQGTIRASGQSFAISGANATTTLTNSGTLAADSGGSLSITGCTWSNGGTLLVNAGTMNLGGTFAALGTINRTGGTINLTGNYTGASLALSNATGPINFTAITFTGTTLSAIDGQSFGVTGATTLSGVTLAAPLNLGGVCGALTITNGLTLQGGATITSAQIGCNQVNFSGPAQAITGTGAIKGNAGSMRIVGTHALTIGPGIVLSNATNGSGIALDAGATLINQGTLRADGAAFSVTGADSTATLLNAPGASLGAINNGTLTTSGCTVTNNGTLVVNTGGTLNLGGTVAALGTVNRSGGTLNLSGNYTGASLALSNATGPINFTAITFTGTTLSAIDGQSFGVTGATTLSGVTLAAPLNLGGVCGALTITNGLTLQGGATITSAQIGCNQVNFSGPAQTIGGTGEIVGNAGSMRIVGTHVLTLGPGVTLRNGPNSTILSLDAGASLINQGTLRGTGAGVGLTISGANSTCTLTNTGSLEAVNGGTLTITACTWSNGGTIVANTGGTFNMGGTLAALGTINRSGGTLNLTGNYTGTNLTLSNATGPINFGGGISFTGTTLNAIDGQVFGISGGTTFSGVTLAAPLTLGGACDVLTITNGLTLQGGAAITTAQIGCNQVNFSGPTQVIGGTGEIIANAGSLRVVGMHTVTFGPGITFRNGANSTSIQLEAGATLINQGTMRATGAGRTLTISGPGSGSSGTLINTGQLQVLSASVFNLNSLLQVTNNGQIVLDPGSVLNVNQGATLTLGSSGRVTFRINGPAAANAGRIVNAGTLNIGGAITVAYVDGYAPTSCTPAATVISSSGGASATGTFTGAIVPPAPGNLRSAVGYVGANVFFAFTSRADVAALGGALTPDGQLTADDIIAFLNAFFSGNLAVADVAGLGGTPGPDGQLTPDDLIVFLDSFFAGCQ